MLPLRNSNAGNRVKTRAITEMAMAAVFMVQVKDGWGAVWGLPF
jgi:hypothetical protein